MTELAWHLGSMMEFLNKTSQNIPSLPCSDNADFLVDAGPRRFHGAARVVGRDDLVDALAHREERCGGGVVGQTALVGDHGRGGEGGGAAAAGRDTKEEEGAEQRRDI